MRFSNLSETLVNLLKVIAVLVNCGYRNGGYSWWIEFTNGYAASVIKNPFSYGGDEDLWELAVMHNGKLCHDTPITSDVMGYLDEDEILAICFKISKLPSRKEDGP